MSLRRIKMARRGNAIQRARTIVERRQERGRIVMAKSKTTNASSKLKQQSVHEYCKGCGQCCKRGRDLCRTCMSNRVTIVPVSADLQPRPVREAIERAMMPPRAIEPPIEKVAGVIEIYTDGGCWPNDGSGRGGYAAIIIDEPGKWRTVSGRVERTTNNQMELRGAIHGLLATPAGAQIKLYSDSKYLVNGITKWCRSWMKNGWTTKARCPVKNVELWQQLIRLTEDRRVTFQWIRGHCGNEFNEMADRAAQRAANGDCRKDAK